MVGVEDHEKLIKKELGLRLNALQSNGFFGPWFGILNFTSLAFADSGCALRQSREDSAGA